MGEIRRAPALENKDESDHDIEMRHLANELLDAIHYKDSKGLMIALKAAFEIFDSMPHVEGEHEEKEEE